jgi:hypothetical protein
MYLRRELLCNLWWWPLNLLRSWLICKLVWNPSWFHGLLGYTGLSLLNRLLGGWFSYLISYNWSVLLHVWLWSLSKTWHQWTKTTVKSKWGQDRWTNKVMWWYEVDHTICDMVGVCVVSTLEEIEWNTQCKGITYRAFHFIGHRCVDKFMIGFMIDGHTIKRGKLICISVI